MAKEGPPESGGVDRAPEGAAGAVHPPSAASATSSLSAPTASPNVRTLGSAPVGADRITVLGLYSWTSFWSLGRRIGANSFFLAPQSYARFGHEVHISMPWVPGEPPYENDQGVQIHRYRGAIRFDSNPRRPLPIRLLSRVVRYVYYMIVGTAAAVRLGRRVKPDLVIGYGVLSAAAGFLTARILGVPNLSRLFGLRLNLFLHSRVKTAAAFLEVFGVIAPCSYLVMHDDGSEGDRVARRLGVPEERIRFYRDGYDPDLYRPETDVSDLRASLQIPAEHTVLFCVGRLGEDKRMDRLVEILPDILREEPAATLLLVGDGVDRPAIEARAAELGVAAHLRITGAIPRERIGPYYHLGDIFIGVSDRSNSNLPPVEAMTCARAVVALDVGGTRTLVRDGFSGLLVDPSQWRAALPRAVVGLLRDPARRRELGRAAREQILAEFPTLDERQRMELEIGLRAVRESRAARAR